MNTQAHSEKVSKLVPIVYDDSVREFGFDAGTDMSRSNKCHTLSMDLMHLLQSEEVEVRRELHKTGTGLWHYVIAHTAIDAPPTERDVITDLNPWDYKGSESFTGYIHAPRHEVMERLTTAGAPVDYVALRSVATIILPHTQSLLTPHTHPPLPIPR